MQNVLAYLSEPAMLLIIAIVFITGIVRGFSGFGSGMIIGPTTSALLTPKLALAIISIVDLIPTLSLVWSARRQVDWSEVIPCVCGYALLIPLGIWVLTTGDPISLRWFISISIFIAVFILWSGWKYTGPRSKPVSIAVGGLGGFMGAAAALPGPAVLIYWLAGSAKALTVRANMIYYLFLTDILVIFGYYYGNIYTWEAVYRAVLCMPGYFIGILIGTRFFRGASETTYRRAAFTMILIAAITSLPVLDNLLR